LAKKPEYLDLSRWHASKLADLTFKFTDCTVYTT
jgi:hypothetical protein